MIRFGTFFVAGVRHFGVVTDEGVISLSGECEHTSIRSAITSGDLPRLSESTKRRSPTHSLDEIVWDIPIPDAEKILCVGVNYPARNEEYKDGSSLPKYMSLFPRFARSFVGHNVPLIRPPESECFDYEGEVAIIIGKPGRRIDESSAYDHIAGLTLCNEGTIRDWVRHAKFNVTQGKNWDSSGSLGPWFVLFESASQLDDILLETRVNGDLRQSDRVSRMMFSVSRQLSYISTFTTLVPGDIIVTGTPTGSGGRLDPPVYLHAGDVVEVSGSGLGVLRNEVIDES